jgi:hypothetical protein
MAFLTVVAVDADKQHTFPQTFEIAVGHMLRLDPTALPLCTWWAEVCILDLEECHAAPEIRSQAEPCGADVEHRVEMVAVDLQPLVQKSLQELHLSG